MQPEARAAGRQGHGEVYDRSRDVEEDSEKDDLRRDASAPDVRELREEGEEEERHLRIQDVGGHSLAKNRPEPFPACPLPLPVMTVEGGSPGNCGSPLAYAP